MQKYGVVLRLLLSAHEDAPKPVHPTVRSFNHPTSRPEAGFAFDGLALFAARLTLKNLRLLAARCAATLPS
jgi:hypothetical protein